ncbi:hypothetical protein F7725_012303 [Dissostichus mawsoni]|uniref:Uncharacterized protein n=1 Tax=Dissostichus mawsoni TaxID=36200 RepID=A0A7J5YNK8_DISMA|nr:hypothetical protein F7725_012303 [Dissostichus mawsoni]
MQRRTSGCRSFRASGTKKEERRHLSFFQELRQLLGEQPQHRGGLVSVRGHGAGQSLGCSGADRLLVVRHVYDQQRAELAVLADDLQRSDQLTLLVLAAARRLLDDRVQEREAHGERRSRQWSHN